MRAALLLGTLLQVLRLPCTLSILAIDVGNEKPIKEIYHRWYPDVRELLGVSTGTSTADDIFIKLRERTDSKAPAQKAQEEPAKKGWHWHRKTWTRPSSWSTQRTYRANRATQRSDGFGWENLSNVAESGCSSSKGSIYLCWPSDAVFGISALFWNTGATFTHIWLIYCMVNVGKCGIDGLLGGISGMILLGPFHASSPSVWMLIGND